MPRFESSVEVDVPVRVAYDQWTQFEDFPRFMDNVERVDQLDDKRLLWVAEIAGQRKEWTAEITDQTPDTRVAWRSTSGDQNDGAALFEQLGPNRTRVSLRIDADPKGPVETIGANLGVLEAAVKSDLQHFKEFIESRQDPTGAWRGEIHGQEVRSDEVRSR
ncbi:MAG: SRPBCC family protein [Chloroflexota bacterium]